MRRRLSSVWLPSFLDDHCHVALSMASSTWTRSPTSRVRREDLQLADQREELFLAQGLPGSQFVLATAAMGTEQERRRSGKPSISTVADRRSCSRHRCWRTRCRERRHRPECVSALRRSLQRVRYCAESGRRPNFSSGPNPDMIVRLVQATGYLQADHRAKRILR